MAREPKWLTPDRKQYLVELWYKVGNRCLLGHVNCPEVSHYAYPEKTYYKVAVPRVSQMGYDIAIGETTDYVPMRLYDCIVNDIIADWKAQDRELRRINNAEEDRNLHRLPTRNRNFFEFNADQFYHDQPVYYTEGLGLSAVTLLPFVKVRISSTYQVLYVDLPKGIFNDMSRNRRRKCIRYGKPLPEEINQRIHARCFSAVRDYLK